MPIKEMLKSIIGRIVRKGVDILALNRMLLCAENTNAFLLCKECCWISIIRTIRLKMTTKNEKFKKHCEQTILENTFWHVNGIIERPIPIKTADIPVCC